MAKLDKATEMASQLMNDIQLDLTISDYVAKRARGDLNGAFLHGQAFFLRLFTIMESYEGFNIYEREAETP